MNKPGTAGFSAGRIAIFFRLLPRGFDPVGKLRAALAGGFVDGLPKSDKMMRVSGRPSASHSSGLNSRAFNGLLRLLVFIDCRFRIVSVKSYGLARGLLHESVDVRFVYSGSRFWVSDRFSLGVFNHVRGNPN
jgi:hypothetical protein